MFTCPIIRAYVKELYKKNLFPCLLFIYKFYNLTKIFKILYMHEKMMLSLKPSYNTQVEEEIVIYSRK